MKHAWPAKPATRLATGIGLWPPNAPTSISSRRHTVCCGTAIMSLLSLEQPRIKGFYWGEVKPQMYIIDEITQF
jgi:hypothetical protein